MCRVGGEIAHVLQVDDHTEAREHRAHHHGDDAGTLHIDAGISGHFHILAHSPHILAQLGLAEPDNEQAGKGNENQGQHRNLHAAHGEGQQVVQALPHLQQAHGVADAVASGQLDGSVLDGDDGAHHIQHHQLIDAGHKESDHVAGDHLPALGLVQDLTDEHTQAYGEGNGKDRRQDKTGNAPDLPVRHKNQGDLSGHGSQGHAEVQAHTGHNGDEKAQNQERISAQTGHNFVEQVSGRKAGGGDAVGADQNEHNGHGIVAQEGQNLLAHGLLTQTGGIVVVCHFYLPPSVFRVKA